MMKLNCMNCIRVVGKTIDGHKEWGCKLNGFTVNARMSCDEWMGPKAMAMRDVPRQGTSAHVFDQSNYAIQRAARKG